MLIPLPPLINHVRGLRLLLPEQRAVDDGGGGVHGAVAVGGGLAEHLLPKVDDVAIRGGGAGC